MMTQESGKRMVTIPMTVPYGLTFLLLFYLCYEAHETFHHLVGGMLCGGFGSMTFNEYVPKPDCALDAAVTLSGPALSFAIAWLGAWMLWQHKQMVLAYTLIFASFAHARFPLPLAGGGDEWLVARTSLEHPNRYLLAGALFLLALPPLVMAYRSIANRRRLPVFVASWLFPFLPLFLLPYLDGWLLPEGSGPAALIGIPLIVLAVDTVAVLLFLYAEKRILRQSDGLGFVQEPGLSS